MKITYSLQTKCVSQNCSKSVNFALRFEARCHRVLICTIGKADRQRDDYSPKDEDPDVRTNALFALGDMGGCAPSTFSDDGRAPVGRARRTPEDETPNTTHHKLLTKGRRHASGGRAQAKVHGLNLRRSSLPWVGPVGRSPLRDFHARL